MPDLPVLCLTAYRLFAGPSEAEPKALMEAVISDAGFTPVFVGPIRYARNLEVRRVTHMSC